MVINFLVILINDIENYGVRVWSWFTRMEEIP